MKKPITILTALILLAGCSATNPDTDIKPAAETLSEEIAWISDPLTYDGTYDYFSYGKFAPAEVLVDRNYCEVVLREAGDSGEGDKVYCDKLKEDLPYYDIKEISSVFEGDFFRETGKDGILSDIRTPYEETEYCKILSSATKIVPVPSVYCIDLEDIYLLETDDGYDLGLGYKKIRDNTYLLGIRAFSQDDQETSVYAIACYDPRHTSNEETGTAPQLLWEGKEKPYEGDYSYLELPLFRDNDIPTLRTACKVNKTDSIDGLAGAWVYCEELNEDLTYYDLKEVTSGIEDRAMYLTEDGYLTKETVLFKDSLFYKYLSESEEYTPIPGIYSFSGRAPLTDIYSNGYARREQGLEYLIYGNDTNRMSFGVIDIGDGYHILTLVCQTRVSANTMATGEPKVKLDYYWSMAIVR